jgi:hypothetical protein
MKDKGQKTLENEKEKKKTTYHIFGRKWPCILQTIIFGAMDNEIRSRIAEQKKNKMG